MSAAIPITTGEARWRFRLPEPAVGGLTASTTDTKALSDDAAALHQAGMLADAARLYREVLRRQPENFDALHNLGVLLHQQGRHAEALVLLDGAVRLAPSSADALTNRGIVCMALGQDEAAVASFDRAVEAKPDHAPAHFARGNALLRMRRHEEALASLNRAIELNRENPEAFNNRGVALRSLDRLEQALASFEHAVALRPGYADAHYNRGTMLQALGRFEEALASFDAALALRPDYAAALNNRGTVLRALDQPREALADYEKALSLTPNFPEALHNKADTLQELNRPEEALAVYDRAIALDPGHVLALSHRADALRMLGRLDEALDSVARALELEPDNVDALNNRGGILLPLGRYAEAIASYDRILTLSPDFADAVYNRAVVLQQLNRHTDAVAWYDRAIALRPDYANAHWNRSLCRLAVGDFARGWREYEWRWQTTSLRRAKRDVSQPLWLGDADLAGRTILLYGEQGFGDILQFCRYVPLVAARTRVILQVPGTLVRLMATLDEGGELVASGEELPEFDLHCPLLSLPLAFRTTLATIPAETPYLRADAALSSVWRDRLAALPGVKVGLVWAGGKRPNQPETGAVDRRRSMALTAMAPLAGVAGCSFVSLQKGEPAAQAARPPPGLVLHDFTTELGDFADTAALIENLDLVIGVDTAVVHLAGALGKPVWLLNRFDTCWRWLLEREDSPWYPTLRQFRQPSPGDWASPISRVAKALRALAG